MQQETILGISGNRRNLTQGTGCIQNSWKVWRRAGQGKRQGFKFAASSTETGSFRDYRKRAGDDFICFQH